MTNQEDFKLKYPVKYMFTIQIPKKNIKRDNEYREVINIKSIMPPFVKTNFKSLFIPTFCATSSSISLAS